MTSFFRISSTTSRLRGGASSSPTSPTLSPSTASDWWVAIKWPINHVTSCPTKRRHPIRNGCSWFGPFVCPAVYCIDILDSGDVCYDQKESLIEIARASTWNNRLTFYAVRHQVQHFVILKCRLLILCSCFRTWTNQRTSCRIAAHQNGMTRRTAPVSSDWPVRWPLGATHHANHA